MRLRCTVLAAWALALTEAVAQSPDQADNPPTHRPPTDLCGVPKIPDGAPVELPIYLAFDFNKGDVKSQVQPDLPFPTAPKKPIEAQAAQASKFNGVVVLGMIVEPEGVPGDIWVKQKLGLGLDQKAIEAVQRWRFRPAIKNGQPVAVPINIEVSFHLY